MAKLFSEKRVIRDAFIASLPVLAGYIFLGMGFGVLLEAKGYSPLWALLMSMFLYAGSMQYVGVELLATGASLITTALTTLTVQARHLFYSITLIDKYKGIGAKKVYMIHALTDETYSLVIRDYDPLDKERNGRYCFFVSLFDHLYWISGCVLGAVVGAILPFSSEGIDFVMTALFVTIFVEQWQSTKDHLPALIGMASALVALLIFGADNFLIPAMIIIMVVFTALRFTHYKEKGVEKNAE